MENNLQNDELYEVAGTLTCQHASQILPQPNIEMKIGGLSVYYIGKYPNFIVRFLSARLLNVRYFKVKN